jgi:hypothetical protein
VTHPGITKARELPLVLARRKLLLRTFDERWRVLFAEADIVSEGSVRREPHGAVWYGSTSLIVPATGADLGLVAELAKRDIHFRLRALRMARREACLRAPARLGRLVGEIQIRPSPGGLRIDVDIQAPLIERGARSRRAARATPRP